MKTPTTTQSISLQLLSRWFVGGGLLLLAGCSAQQTYQAGQTWQRNECQKLNDAQARGRCLESASAAYDTYQRQVDADVKVK